MSIEFWVEFYCIVLFRNSSPLNSPRQSAIAQSFAEANSVFIVITSAKNIAKVIIS